MIAPTPRARWRNPFAAPLAVNARLERSRWYRPICVGLTAAVLAVAVVFVWVFWLANRQHFGEDLEHYLDGTRRWWATGSPYLPWEVAGKFDYEVETFLHPPVSVLFFAPWAFLPPILWWAVPIGIVTALVVLWRPAPWTWPLIAFGLGQPQLHQALLWGNTNLWLAACLGLGLVIGWPAVFLLLKPSIGMFGIVGIHRRSWWVMAIPIGVLCIPFGLLWVDWVRVVLNSPADATYGIRNLPWLLIPVIAYVGRTRELPEFGQ